MNRSPAFRIVPIVLAFVVVGAAPLRGQVGDAYVVPAVARTAGAAGTFWFSEFHVMNPQRHDLVGTIVYMSTGGDTLLSFDFDMPANATVWAEDILAEFGLETAGGSLLVATLPENNPGLGNDRAASAFVLQTRTYNELSNGSTLGQAIPGAITGLLDLDLDGITAIATGVRNLGAPGVTGFRTNVGAVNLSDWSTTLWVTVWDDAGNLLAELPNPLPPQGHVQVPLPVAVDHGTVEFYVDFPAEANPHGADLVFPYASVIDNRTGDPVYLDPKLLATPLNLFPYETGAVRRGPERITADQIRPIVEKAVKLGRASLARGTDGRMRLRGPAQPE
ncbi:MAG TPA: hypothetical protein VMS56_00840 [Thermoanaerobaculia bacterium]|nr:hypothetical protein [Thermoanaerobaculia bacterium]